AASAACVRAGGARTWLRIKPFRKNRNRLWQSWSQISAKRRRAAPASPPPFTGEGQGGGMQQDSFARAHPLPNPPPPGAPRNPPPPGAPRDAPRRGDPVAGEGAHRVRGAE